MNVNRSNIEEKKAVITWYEILGIIIVFAISLYILFPEKMIHQLILKDSKNIELTIKYLESLISLNPKDKKLKLLLLDYYVKNNMLENAENYITSLINDEDFKNDYQFNFNIYNLYKKLYFDKNSEKYKKLAKKQLKKLLMIATSKQNYQKIYKESLNMNFVDIRYESLQSLFKLTKDKKFLAEFEDLYKQALNNLDFDLAIKTADTLYQITNDIKWVEKKSEIYLNFEKDITSVSKTLLLLFEKTHDKKYFKKLLNILIWKDRKEIAIKLIDKYTNYFISKNDTEMLIFFLKFYLSEGLTDRANKLSVKILNKMDRL